jgi:hypothetical protein
MKVLRRRFTADEACKCGGKAARSATADAITASGFFTAEQIGSKQSLTPEGFLLCEDVPIARVGTQDYAYFELPELEAKDGVIVAERTADVLFSPETLASFEGKPVTIGHPDDFVNPGNWAAVAKGIARNVRRGDSEQADLMLADLLITDAEAIRQVRQKLLQQVSNGYDADYEQIAPGRARQVTITGNHIALVKSARCGPVCSIGDSKPNSSGEPKMKKKPGQSTLLDKLRQAFMTRDSDAFEEAASEMTGDDDASGGSNSSGQPQIHIHVPGAAPNADKPTGDDGAGGGTAGAAAGGADDPLAKVLGAIEALGKVVQGIGERVTKLEAGGTADDPEGDPNGEGTNNENPDASNPAPAKTGDSAQLRDEFRDAMSRAEILAPGVKLPTFDAKAEPKKTNDAICVLRRRALRAALDGDNADVVKTVTGGADVSEMTCDSAKVVFNAASELVKQVNKSPVAGQRVAPTNDANAFENINERNRKFWEQRT